MPTWFKAYSTRSSISEPSYETNRPLFSFRASILFTEALTLSIEISPFSAICASVETYVSSSAKSSFEIGLTGIKRMSTPALIASFAASYLSKCSAIASISIASVVTTPSNPISPRRISVMIVLESVAGRYMVSPVFLDIYVSVSI